MSKMYNNRDRSDRYQGNRSYIHRPGSVEWWRGACALAAIVVSIWFVWHFGFSAEAREKGFHSSRGELAFKHSAWEDKCDACHVPADQITNAEHKEFWSINGRWKEFSCRHCHAGPPHHTYTKSEDKEFDKNCAACHHDHSGKEYSLVRISDDHCTRCHAQLNEHPNQNTKNDNYNPNITAFGKEGGHPEFSALTKPHRRTIKFSHTLHMSPGIFVNQHPADAGDVSSVERIKALQDEKRSRLGERADGPTAFSYVERYQQFERQGGLTNRDGKPLLGKDGQPAKYIQLTCMSCHELDSGRTSRANWNGTDKIVPEAPKESLLPPRAEGAYYLPVNFEKHCQACHPVAIDFSTRDNHKFKLDLPHRKQLSDFEKTLRDRVLGLFLTEEPEKGGALPLPSRLDKPLVPSASPLSNEGKKEVDRLVEKAKKEFFDTTKKKPDDQMGTTIERARLAINTGATCQKCHFVKDYFVEPGNTPAVWFEHSKFSHVGHRAMRCVECHKNYAADTPFDPVTGDLKWEDPEEWGGPKGIQQPSVDIAGVAECQKCHSPAKSDPVSGGVRYGCTDCHRYHNAEFPLQGMGAINRDPGYDPERGLIGTTPDLNPLLDRRRDPTKRFDWNQLLKGLPPDRPKPQ